MRLSFTGIGVNRGLDFFSIGYGRGTSSEYGFNLGGSDVSVGVAMGISIPFFEIDTTIFPTPSPDRQIGY
jgi:hypothetical protein